MVDQLPGDLVGDALPMGVDGWQVEFRVASAVDGGPRFGLLRAHSLVRRQPVDHSGAACAGMGAGVVLGHLDFSQAIWFSEEADDR